MILMVNFNWNRRTHWIIENPMVKKNMVAGEDFPTNSNEKWLGI